MVKLRKRKGVPAGAPQVAVLAEFCNLALDHLFVELYNFLARHTRLFLSNVFWVFSFYYEFSGMSISLPDFEFAKNMIP